MLEELGQDANPRDLLKDWSNGRLKLYVTWRLLNFRREHSDLFLQGEYIPLRVVGSRANHVIAFARRLHDDWCVVAVPRLLAKLGRGKQPWEDTSVELPAEAPADWTKILTNDEISSPLLASVLFSTLPLAVLTPRKYLEL
jgi:(1->4)-alpha-D-glucan 1-alpha-D-glucosylmutase